MIEHAAAAGAGRILLIERGDALRVELATVLVGDGWTVDAAATVDDALGAPTPDVVIAETGPPGHGGVELLRRIRASTSDALAPLPVILLIGPEPDALRKALAAGAEDYLQLASPFDRTEFLARVRIRYLLAHPHKDRHGAAEEAAQRVADAITDKRLLAVAIGILMAACGISAAQATDLLRAAARPAGRTIKALAAEIVDTRSGGSADLVTDAAQVSWIRGERCSVRISAAGPLDLVGSVVLAAALNKHIEAGYRHVVIDLSNVTFMAEAGIDALLVAQNRLKALEGTLSLAGASQRIRRLLQVTRRAAALQFEPDVKDADPAPIASVSGPT